MFKKKSYSKQLHNPPSKLFIYLNKIFLFLLTILLSNFLVNIYFFKKDPKTAVLLNPIASQIIHSATTFINSRQNSKHLENIVLNVLGDSKNNYSVVIFNTESGERYYLNEDRIYDTASLYKLWIMAVSFEQIEQNKISQTEVLSDSISSISNKFNLTLDTNQDPNSNVSWPVQNALEKMITLSDNNSAYLLTEKVGIKAVSDFLSKQGFSESKVGDSDSGPKTSASDMAVFLERLYNGKFANSSNTTKMINLLKNQQVKTKLAKYLPKNAVIAHKTGELGSFSHDVGIVYLSNGNYIIAVLSNTSNQLDANEKIAQLSKKVYDYFSSK